jgi:hypothetical protein
VILLESVVPRRLFWVNILWRLNKFSFRARWCTHC